MKKFDATGYSERIYTEEEQNEKAYYRNFGYLFFLMFASSAFAQQRFVNESGRPFKILTLNDTQGRSFGALFMSGKEMVLDSDGNPISGAGYYEALEGDYIYIPSN